MKKYSYVLLLSLILFSCQKKNESKEQETLQASDIIKVSAVQFKNAGLQITNPTERQVNGLIKLQGTITVPPKSLVSVSIPLGGYIKQTGIVAGMQINKGQQLAIVEDIQYVQLQQDYLLAKERFALAQSEYARQKELNAKKASSDKLLEQTTTEMQTQRISMAAIAQKLELIGINPRSLSASTIRKNLVVNAPVSGVVSKVNINTGKYVSSSEVLFEITELKDIMLVLNVYEKDLKFLNKGQVIKAYSNTAPQEQYVAKIVFINTSLNTDRAAEVICKFNSYNSNLMPGLYMNANMEFDQKVALTVPEEAIVKWQGKNYIFKDLGNLNYKMIAISLGEADQGYRQVNSNSIDKNTKIVGKNAYALLMAAQNSGDE